MPTLSPTQIAQLREIAIEAGENVDGVAYIGTYVPGTGRACHPGTCRALYRSGAVAQKNPGTPFVYVTETGKRLLAQARF
jgi:hypothetical protein